MSNSDEEKSYDLKGSTALVGQLYPVLKAKDGDLLDGAHRSDADANWRTEILENIDTPEKKLAARLIANIHRRTVPKEEKEGWINDLAALYLAQGLKIKAASKSGKGGQGSNEISKRIAAITGLSKKTVTGYLDPKFKQMAHSRGIYSRRNCVSSAAEVIVNILNSHSAGSNPGYGNRLLERYKEELLKSPLFRMEVMNSLPKGKGFKRMVVDVDVNVLGLSGNDAGDPVGTIKRKLPKGEGLPKKDNPAEILDLAHYYEMFMRECPDCQCAGCAHAEECIDRVRADEPFQILTPERLSMFKTLECPPIA